MLYRRKVIVMINLLITLAIGGIGALIALRLKVPAGAMVGSMLAVALFNVVTGEALIPQNVRIITQIAAGAFIGAGVSYKDVAGLKSMVKPAILMVSSMIVLDLIMGYIMYKTTDIDLVTSLFACAPGGIVDMSIISSDLGADSSKVAILQMVRLMSVFALLPSIMKFLSSRIEKKVAKKQSKSINISEVELDKKCLEKDKKKYVGKEALINLGITTIIATIAGLIGYKLKIPAGTMTFSMVAIGILNIFTGRGYMPLNIRRMTQVFAGALIGEKMTFADLMALKGIVVPALILLIGIILVNLCIGIFISKVSDLELITSLLASAPGGVSDMALIAKDLGGDGPKVAILQLARYVCIIAFFPIIIKYISLLV
ncbi:AbrB family transcriptional regulator [Desnuesiella massiliensis]|uniref:AbrB family transcriptional regulator n=1 Tax=Desnuesiella massiliensis TaxID=1650662 RepID=UPI001FA6AA4E|nr:AbrB family transcriptional regulator [Desnuesiella massiliensis]